MAGIKYMPEDWAEMIQGIQTWASDNVPSGWSAVFAKQVVSGSGAPQPAKPFVFVQVLVPPVAQGQGDAGEALFVGTAITVKTVLDATTYTVTINGNDADFVSDADATEEEIIDGLLAEIIGLGEPVTATKVVVPAGSIAFAINLVKTGATDPTLAVSADLRIKRLSATENESVATFQIDAVGRDEPEAATVPGPLFESVAAITGLQNSLETAEVLEQLLAAGWTVTSVEGERKPDAVAGAAWEDRSGFDLRLRCRTRDLRIGDFIESVEVGVAIVGTLSP
jgi:hypothetical protein